MELQIKKLTKSYSNGFQALKNVSLDIPYGMFGILDPNVAGESSLMRTPATLQEADSGTITLGDLDIFKRQISSTRDTRLPSLGIWSLSKGEFTQYARPYCLHQRCFQYKENVRHS